jgi:hypothetical protein
MNDSHAVATLQMKSLLSKRKLYMRLHRFHIPITAMPHQTKSPHLGVTNSQTDTPSKCWCL